MLSVNVGDTVKFVPSDKGHNSESIKGMLPKGAKKWKGKINMGDASKKIGESEKIINRLLYLRNFSITLKNNIICIK